ncbi:uncharacterized protein BP5553_07156 [Venustampulla echinocandica]|uniref:LPXTG-domain-containing protein n=1 Tax=Venustampulla echinocandica TaxID=2656787 RepID=A0A370TIN9_9HELO|nr:uncharacterized protein BP5553_07156 [Venustampulla echinocandica]RDL35225.1 hypothetical protein BP5553_07156 [Venustampulla echinocandica]
MVLLPKLSIVPVLLLASNGLAFKVTPGSPCTEICREGSAPESSEADTSNTFGSEIACQDKTLNTTDVGKKFKACVSCLQNSTTSASSGNDQEWFLYNLRYALGSCLFGFANASDAVSTPCSTSTACGPLQKAIENADLVPSNEGTYSYCTADDHAILGSFQPKCTKCLQDSGVEVYLSNFLIALKAGCTQQPPAGTMIGLDSTVFTTKEVNITWPGYNPNDPPKAKEHKALSKGAIIGIAVGLAALFLIASAIIFIYCRKRRALDHLKALNSPLDSRFGATNITSPNAGAYGNPYGGSPPINAAPLQLYNAPKSRLSKDQITHVGEVKDQNSWHRYSPSHSDSQPPVYVPSSTIPTHQAYIASPAESHSTKFSMSPGPSPEYPPSRVSPHYSQQAHQSLLSTSTQSRHNTPLPSPPSRISPKYTTPINTQAPPQIPRAPSRNQGISTNTLATHASIDGSTGPSAARYEGRYDFELAEQERREREARGEVVLEPVKKKKKKKKSRGDDTPDSAVSEEQWPGSY